MAFKQAAAKPLFGNVAVIKQFRREEVPAPELFQIAVGWCDYAVAAIR